MLALVILGIVIALLGAGALSRELLEPHLDPAGIVTYAVLTIAGLTTTFIAFALI